MIIKDKQQLKQICEPTNIKDGEEIAVRLLHELRQSDNGIGLAANQIGINKRVCVVNVKEPLVLINPKIVEKSKEQFLFVEGCLSFKNETIKTARHKWVTVEADNHTGQLHFGVWDEKNKEGYNKQDKLDYALETVCVQHEIDHLNGITMFDREVIFKQLKSNKIGRNQKVTIEKGSESKVIKYKKATPYLEDGWTLVENS